MPAPDCVVSEDMAKWTVPFATKGEVSRAGKILAEGALFAGLSYIERAEVLNTINNWRSSHSYPQHIAKKTLQTRVKRIDERGICAQRLKRLPSIITKLRRNPNMKLSQMQDIGGCRAIMPSVATLVELIGVHEEAIRKNPPRKEQDKDKPITRSGWNLVERYNYIRYPKLDGYRSYHYVFKYLSKYEENKKYNGLRIEIQLRTQMQHYWATAVEAVSIFTEQALKSGIGRPEWKRFFALMGSAIALREGTPLVPETPVDPVELVGQIKWLYSELQVDIVLRGITATVQMRGESGAQAFLLVLDTKEKKLDIKGYKASELTEANQEYLLVEERYVEDPTVQAVLVSVDSLQILENAYPNYYLDTAEFLSLVNRVITEDVTSLIVEPASLALSNDTMVTK
jgi:ppGpp synthetase/RelA/SpoT-type nucleotidyltranferase